MKKLYTLILLSTVIFITKAQIINFTDPNLKARLLEASPNNYIAQNIAGGYFKIDSNNDGEIQISEAVQVKRLTINNQTNYYSGIPYTFYITSLDGISNFQNLQYLDCSYNQLTSINLNLPQLLDFNCSYNQLPTLNLNGINSNLRTLTCSFNYLSSINVNSFTSLTHLICQNNYLTTLNINNLVNLSTLDCSNNPIYTLDLNNFPNLEYLLCSNIGLSSLNLTGLNLIILFCEGNNLQVLDVSNQTALKSLWCGNNQLSVLDVSNLVALENLICYGNQIGVLNVSNMPNLRVLNCHSNQIQALDLDTKVNLIAVHCSDNLLTSLSMSSANLLYNITCYNNLLQTLNINNDAIENTVEFYNNPTLTYICADGEQIAQIQDLVTQYGYTNCGVNSICSSNPNGNFYTIQGNNKLDYDINGCSLTDMNYPNLKITFSDSTNSGYMIANESGNYDYDVEAGTFSINPELENPNYFNISPTTSNVTFPTQISPYFQNFCIVANGNHNDLEITLIPMFLARPGFDSNYKIVYKNKGTTIQSGTVTLNFNDAILDLVDANPNFTNQSTNNLNWSFIGLMPLEKREIEFTLNLNSPLETPALNGGDILNYTASVVGLQDETSNDNTFVLNQTVVNSFDPNDIMCLEGETISIDKVGEYVHYRIRFENTGTANAENIVVKNLIDTEKFEIDSVRPIDKSHNCIVRVVNNEINFIFDNINLPFDDANNDGYIVYKIKTKASLVSGDVFSNTASIFFDFNAPIMTNNYTTTVTTNSIENLITLSPVPANEILVLTLQENVNIIGLTVYNIIGQSMNVNLLTMNTINLSNLKTGTYILKVDTSKGTANAKFIKE